MNTEPEDIDFLIAASLRRILDTWDSTAHDPAFNLRMSIADEIDWLRS